ncbi:MAG: hypothetical protein ACI89E_000768, partial [Planctomycetota bacterium]
MVVNESVVSTQSTKRPWGKYLKRMAIGVLILAVLLRMAVPLALPSILNRIAAGQGLQIDYSKLDLSLFGGSMELWDVSICPVEQSPQSEIEPAAELSRLGQMEFLTVDVDLSALLGGTLRAHRVEIDGLDVFAKRESLEAGWTWATLLPGETSDTSEDAYVAKAEPSDDSQEEDAATAPFDWTLGFEVSAIRLQHLQLHVQDRAVEPGFSADLELNVRLSHLGLAETPARLEVFAHSLEFLDGFSVEGSLLASGANLRVAAQVDMRGLRPLALEPYLAPFGIVPLARRIDCGLQLEVITEAANEQATALKVDVKVREVQWLADGDELMALDEMTIEVPSFLRGSLSLETARISGVRGHARRTAGGALAIAGFRLDGAPNAATPADSQAIAAPAPESNSAPFEFSIPKLELSEVALHWLDETLVPSASVDLELSTLTIGPLQSLAGVASEAIHIEANLSAPGVVESMQLQGDVQAFADVQTVDLQVTMAGLKPERVAPYLHAAGLRSDFEAGTGSALIKAQTHVASDGVRHLEASLSEVKLEDGETLFAIGSVAIKDLQIDNENGSTRLGDLTIEGTRLKARRDSEGLWHVLGLIVDPSVAVAKTSVVGPGSSEPTATEKQVAPVTDTSSPALIELGRIALTDVQIELLDESMTPQVHQVFDDLGLVLTDLKLGGEASQETRAPANLEMWFRADGLAQRLALQGTLQSQPGPLDLAVNLNVIGQDLELTAVQPWLAEAGIESLWQDAQLALRIDAHVQQIADETHLSVQLADLKFENQGQSWLSMGALSVPSVVLSDSGITLQPIRIDRPELLLRRDGQGVLQALALRILPRENSTEPASTPNSPGPEPASGDDGGDGPVVNLAGLEIQGVQVRWQDAFVEPRVETTLRFDLGMQNLALGQVAADPMAWLATIAVDDNLGSLQVEGQAWLDPADLRLKMQVAMEGLRPGSLASYMPENLAMELTDGRLAWNVEARYAESESGGHSLNFEAQDLVFTDGDAGADLLRLPRLALNLPILDPTGQRFDIQEISMKGLVLPTRIDTEGRVHGLGFSFTPPAEGSAPAPASAPEVETPTPVLKPQIITPGGTDRVEVSKASDRVLPLVTLNGLDVGIDRFSFVDERGGVPLEFGLHLTQFEPMTLIAPEAADLPALKLKITGAAKPIVDSIAVEMEIAPYANEPSFGAHMLISGVHGDQVTRVLPGLAEILDGSAWTDGQIEAHVQTHLITRRRGPLDFDFAQGFGLELVMDQVSVRATAEGPDLLGFEELTASVPSIRPLTGDVHVKRVEWVNPHGSAWQDEVGLHAAGWVLKAPTPVDEAKESLTKVADQPTETETQETGAEETAAVEPDGATENVASANQVSGASMEQDPIAQAKPSPEIRVDEVLISGGNFLFEDRTVQPNFVFPIADVDLQVKRFTTRTLEEAQPFSFRLALYGGDIALAERTGGGNLIGGILGSVAALAGDNKFETEQRPVFDELTLRGKLSLGPIPKGWVQMRLRGFELPSVRGFASEAGVDIGDGLMGESTMLHFDGSGGLRISSQTNFTYLSLSEPPGGPISSYLKLPAPLDSVLFVLKDEDGDHGIPLHLTMDEGGASMGAILGAVTKSLGLLIG